MDWTYAELGTLGRTRTDNHMQSNNQVDDVIISFSSRQSTISLSFLRDLPWLSDGMMSG